MRSSTPVRHALALALLILTTSLVACGGNVSTTHVGLAPSGFVLQPDISDVGRAGIEPATLGLKGRCFGLGGSMLLLQNGGLVLS
jgi:hypothetical protein